MSELTYLDIEAYRYASKPRNTIGRISRFTDFCALAKEFPDEFPERMSDERLFELAEEVKRERLQYMRAFNTIANHPAE